ncbi:hypothetical protein MTO96_034976 [Rhipicephalus appendiculatus]
MTTGQKKLVRSKSGLRIVTVGNEELSPFHLDEPPWTPDRETADCWRCRSKFDFITRRPAVTVKVDERVINDVD